MRHHYYLLCLLAIALTACPLQSAVLVSYTFDTANGTIGPKLSPTTYDASISATAISSPATVTLASKNGLPSDLLAAAPTSGQSTISIPNTLSAGTYFSFTLTPNAGTAISLTDITFTALTGGSAAPRAFYLFTDLTGISNGNELGTGIYQNTVGDTLTTTSTSYDFSLSSPALQNLTTSVQFRFYIQALNAGQTIAFDNIVINGTTFAVPEPGIFSLGLISLAGLAVSLKRRGRKMETSLAA